MSTDRDDAAAKDELKYDELKPILPGPAGSDYENYLRTDELLSLQKTSEEMVHRDERLFQTVHQSSELWLKLACFEIDEAIVLLGQDEIRRALRLLGRANHCIVIVDRGAAHARAPLALGVPRGAQGARPRQRLRLAGLPRVPRPRAPALGGLRGDRARAAGSRSPTPTCRRSSIPTCTTSPRR